MKMTVNKRYARGLAALGLTTGERVMAFDGGDLVRHKGIRKIVRFRLPGDTPCTVYLKTHIRSAIGELFGQLLHGEMPRSQAAHEYRAIRALGACGVRTIDWVAYGEAEHFSWCRASFIITVEAEGERLEDYVGFLKGRKDERRCIIQSLAELVRLMHGAGLNHRDLYLCHIFYRPDTGGDRLALIDLQRIRRRARRFNRWVVKDLAALNYSAPRSTINGADRIRFVRRYLRVGALGRREKRFVRKIIRKTERIRRHDVRLQGKS